MQEHSGGKPNDYIITQRRPDSLRDNAGNFANGSLSTRFKKVIRTAGLTPWPKPWTNLRATRDTELREEFPSHVVDAWIGHREEVAKRRYLMVTDDHFAKAASETVRKPVRYGTESPRTASQTQIADAHKPSQRKEKRPHAGACSRNDWTILDLNQ